MFYNIAVYVIFNIGVVNLYKYSDQFIPPYFNFVLNEEIKWN